MKRVRADLRTSTRIFRRCRQSSRISTERRTSMRSTISVISPATRHGRMRWWICSRERAIPGISGNYDSTVATDYKHCGCRADTPHDEELSHLSYEWTRAHVTPRQRSTWRAFLSASTSGRWRTRLGPDDHSRPRQSDSQHGVRDRGQARFFSREDGSGAGSRAGCRSASATPTSRGSARSTESGSSTRKRRRPKDGDRRACYVCYGRRRGYESSS